MDETYAQYVIRHLAETENALFEARNAYMGTGIDRNNRIARELDKMRAKVAQWAHDETRRAIK